MRFLRCLIELYTAIEHDIPIIALNCVGKGYDFIEASDFMLHLETSLQTLNPDALDVLNANGVDPVRLAHKLWSVLPNIISIPLNTSASDNAIKAAIHDLANTVMQANPSVVSPDTFASWLDNRGKKEQLDLESAVERGTIRGTQRGRMLQKLGRVDELTKEVEKKDAQLEKKDAMLEKKDTMLERKETMIEKLMAKIEKLEEKAEQTA